jgi:uncharacterized peroxidase-related enzyme
LIYDYRTADLSESDRALCDHAVRLTLSPSSMTQHNIATLHAAGFTDQQITVATQVIGYFNYINRIADGLGVDAETEMVLPVEQWRTQKGRHYLAAPQ